MSVSSIQPWHDGSTFYTHRWVPSSTPPTPPRALIILVHGFAEYAGRYSHVWKQFVEANIEVYGYDQRGYGETAKSTKGGYGNTSIGELVTDLAYAVQQERKRLDKQWVGKNVPIFLYGHSMGGGEVLTFVTLPHLASTDITDATKMISGVIASSPWILLTNPPDALTMFVSPLVLRLAPNLPHTAPLDPTALSNDRSVGEAYIKDPLISGKVKIKTILGSLTTGPKLMSTGIKHWPEGLPLLVTHGLDDQITSPKASREFVDKVRKESKGGEGMDLEWKGWERCLHEGHNELPDVREPFLAYSVQWIVARTPEVAANPDAPLQSNL